jgi:hypothetical protein
VDPLLWEMNSTCRCGPDEGGKLLALDAEDAVDLDGDVVLGDGGLVRDGDGLLLERVDVGDVVDEGGEHVDPGAERLDILVEQLHHERLLLQHDAHPPPNLPQQFTAVLSTTYLETSSREKEHRGRGWDERERAAAARVSGARDGGGGGRRRRGSRRRRRPWRREATAMTARGGGGGARRRRRERERVGDEGERAAAAARV